GNAPEQLGRALVESNPRSMPQRPSTGNEFDNGVEALGRLECARSAQRISAGEIADVDAAQIDGDAASRVGHALVSAVNLQTTDLHAPLTRQHHQLAVVSKAAGNQCSGHDSAEP